MKLPAHEVREYTDQCADLPPGGTRRFNHTGCATSAHSTSLAVTRTDTGLVVFCHKCNGTGGSGGVYRRDDTAPKVGKASYKKSDWEYRYSEWPIAVKVWLNRCKVDNEIYERMGVRYDRANERLQFPIYGDEAAPGTVTGRINRNFAENAGSKYISTGQRWWLRCTDSQYVVVAEDWLSATQATCAGLCSVLLGGTRLSSDCLSALLESCEGKTIVIYLDNDNPDVRRLQRVLYNTLAMYFEVVVIRETRDPKELTYEELQMVVNRAIAMASGVR